MKYLFLAGLLVFSIPFLAACSTAGMKKPSKTTQQSAAMTDAPSSDEGSYHKISADEAKKMMDEGNVTIVDVRTASEYASGHIPGALLVPNETISDEASEKLPDKNAVLLVHCRTGIRSKQASDKLVELGYKNVYDFGGILDWPYETEEGEFLK